MTDKETSAPYGDEYKWPDTFYGEMRDMAALSFMCYSFGYIVNLARKQEGGLKGLSLDENSEKSMVKSNVSDSALKRSFAPLEIKQIVEDNVEALSKEAKDFRGRGLKGTLSALEKLDARAKESGLDRPLTLEEFDDVYQSKECVYAVCKDDINKRITVVFRGTNDLAFFSNWVTNFSAFQKEVPLPDKLQDKIDAKELQFHTGFYDYLFNETVDEKDEKSKRKMDQILDDVKSLLAKNPGYQVYTTGHSLGAALSSICAFYFALDDDLPKPISCVNFAAPRVGGWDVFQAVHHLEKTKQLRVLRMVNENDLVTTVPGVIYYHFGVQIDCYHKKFWQRKAFPPNITYFNPTEDFLTRFGKTWTNSIITNLNLGYDHADYISRLVANEEYLGDSSLNDIYTKEGIL